MENSSCPRPHERRSATASTAQKTRQTVATPNPGRCAFMLETQTHHLGNHIVNNWEVTNPEGVLWSKAFDLTNFDYPIFLRFETYGANK